LRRQRDDKEQEDIMAWYWTKKKARKDQECFCCNNKILKGEIYWHNDFSGRFGVHIDCREAFMSENIDYADMEATNE